MHAHNLFVNQGDQRHLVETIIEGLPKRQPVSALDLIEEAVYTGNRL
jgi:hypothetical protein